MQQFNEYLVKFLSWFAAGIGIIFFLLFIVISILHIQYPYILEDQENVHFMMSLQVYEGKQIYRNPDEGFTAYMYPPLYYWVVGTLWKITGLVHIGIPRAVTITSALGSVFLLGLWAKKRGCSIPVVVTLASIPLLLNASTGSYLYAVKCDALCIALNLWAAYILVEGKPTRNYAIISGILFGLAGFTKHSYTPFATFVILASLVEKRSKRPFWALCTFFLTIGVLFGGMQYITDGWFLFYVYTVPVSHGLIPHNLAAFFRIVAEQTGLLLGVVVATGLTEKIPISLLVLIGSLFGSLVQYLKNGAPNSFLFPAYGVGLMGVFLQSHHLTLRCWTKIVFWGMIIWWQLVTIFYTPPILIPIPNEVAQKRSDKLVEQLKTLEEPILAPYMAIELILAGKTKSLDWNGHFELCGLSETYVNKRSCFEKTLQNLIDKGHFRYVVWREMDGAPYLRFKSFGVRYRFTGTHFTGGHRMTPSFVLEPVIENR